MYHQKTILISGASSGLGRNLALHYAKEGGRIVNISRNILKMEELQTGLHNINPINHLYYSANISSYQEVKDIKHDLQQKQIYPNVIIQNAAGNFLCPFERLTENGWNSIIHIVLHGSFNMYHIFGKYLIQQKKPATFLNISTTYANTGSALVIPSSVAKAGVDNMMRGLAVEWSPYNMRFVGIAPGPMEGTGGASKLDPFQVFKHYNTFNNPSKRMATQDEISDLALFLTSEKASYINGEIVTIDGGEVVKNSGEFNFLTNVPFYKHLIRK